MKPKIFQPVLLSILLLSLQVLAGCFSIPAPIETPYNRGVELYDQGKYADAIEQYKLALRKNPDDQFSRYNLAVVYQDQGKLDEAVRLYEEILQKEEDTNSRINLAAIYYDRGDRDRAHKELKQAAESNRDSPAPLSVQGKYLEQENQLDLAEELYLKALAIDDKHAPTHYRLGRLYLRQGTTDQGLEHLQKAVELSPEEPRYLEALANEYEQREQISAAINMLERVSVLQPDREDLFIRLGGLYREKQLYQEALSRYWSAVSLRDDNPEVHRILMEIYKLLAEKEGEQLEQLKDQGTLAQTP